jgi:membrane protein required for colicin V production
MINLINGMNWADVSIITLIFLSAMISFFYGFIEELFSLLYWSFSFIISLIFLNEMTELLTTVISFMDLRVGVAFIILFFVSFIIFKWISYLIINSIGPTPLATSERMVGVFFGLIRGLIIVILLILLAGLTQLPTKPWWQGSLLISYVEPIVIYLRSQLPLNIATEFNFEPPPEFQLPSF